jgi:glutamate 5-kinase
MADRTRYLHIRNTVEALLEEHVVPVINENDSVSVEGVTFGENDRLAAIVAAKIGADALLFLSDEAGLFTRDPKRHEDARLIDLVRPGQEVEGCAEGAGGDESRGGMKKKLEAAEMAVVCGIPVVMTDGRQENVILRALEGETLGTFFVPGERLDSRKMWIATARESRGWVVVNEGARHALTRADGASLLPVGVVEAEGGFRAGDTVQVLGPGREILARGISNFSAEDVRRIKGLPSDHVPRLLGRPAPPEVIHRDNMVVIAG